MSRDSIEWDRCQWYQWFLYVDGNLVSLGNPLTDVSVQSDNSFSQVLDLLISTWSVVLTGIVIGVVSGNTLMVKAVDVMNERMAETARRAEMYHAAQIAEEGSRASGSEAGKLSAEATASSSSVSTG